MTRSGSTHCTAPNRCYPQSLFHFKLQFQSSVTSVQCVWGWRLKMSFAVWWLRRRWFTSLLCDFRQATLLNGTFAGPFEATKKKNSACAHPSSQSYRLGTSPVVQACKSNGTARHNLLGRLCVCVWCLCLIMFANRADVLLTRRPSTPTDDRTPKAEPALSGSISISQAGSQAVCSALSFHPFSGNGPNIEKVTTD